MTIVQESLGNGDKIVRPFADRPQMLFDERFPIGEQNITRAAGFSFTDDGDGEELEPDYFQWSTAEIVEWDPAAASKLQHGVLRPANVTPLDPRERVRFVPDVDDEAPDVDAAADGDGYSESLEGPAVELEVGDLLLVDATLGLWGVVEGVEPDVVDDDEPACAGRSGTTIFKSPQTC